MKEEKGSKRRDFVVEKIHQMDKVHTYSSSYPPKLTSDGLFGTLPYVAKTGATGYSRNEIPAYSEAWAGVKSLHRIARK